MTGPEGPKGDQGPRGAEGRGIQDVVMEEGKLKILLTDGEEKIFTLG